MLFVCWLNPKALDDPNKRHSSILIGLKSNEQAQKCVSEKIWHGCSKHITLRSGAPSRGCYNCQHVGHTAPSCPLKPLFPFCGDKHHSHGCPEKGKMEMKCTACVRKKVRLEPNTDLKALFTSNSADFTHHPFSPTAQPV